MGIPPPGIQEKCEQAEIHRQTDRQTDRHTHTSGTFEKGYRTKAKRP
jgi:hypothetical protein